MTKEFNESTASNGQQIPAAQNPSRISAALRRQMLSRWGQLERERGSWMSQSKAMAVA